MQRKDVLILDPWETIKDTALGALVIAGVGAAWAYIQSIGKKATKAELDSTASELWKKFEERMADREARHAIQLESLRTRVSKWDEEARGFARQSSLDELKRDLDSISVRLESKLDSAVREMTNRVIELFREGKK